MNDNSENKSTEKAIESGTQPKPETAQDGVIAGQSNQAVHGKAFELLHKEDKNPSGLMPALHENFGITGEVSDSDRGDKAPSPQKKESAKVSIDPRPSYVEGLKAIGNDEEAQGAYSIQYMERKATEALVALQKPVAEQVLIASNITPAVPDLQQLQQYEDIQPDSVMSSSEKIALGEEGLEKGEKKKLTPKDGDELTLTQLMTEYKTPFIDAFERSKPLKDGQPGHSKTLEDTVNRLLACPWSDKIRIKFDKNAANPEYDPEISTITINPSHSPMRQIEEFVHEGYHATHQGIGAMYINKASALKPKEYFDVRAQGELGSFLAEIKVNAELNGGTPVEFSHVVNGRSAKENLSAYKDEAKLLGFLLDARPILRKNGVPQYDLFGNLRSNESYREHYESSYGDYEKTFEAVKPKAGAVLKDYQKKNPGKSAADFIKADY